MIHQVKFSTFILLSIYAKLLFFLITIMNGKKLNYNKVTLQKLPTYFRARLIIKLPQILHKKEKSNLIKFIKKKKRKTNYKNKKNI